MTQSRALQGRAAFLYVLTAVSFIGTVVLVAILLTGTHQVCDAVACDQVGNDTTPAFIALAAGTVQTVLLLIIAQMCQTLGRVVDAVSALRKRGSVDASKDGN